MSNIDLLQIGCTGQQIIDTINALVAAHNDGQKDIVSYNDLADKPSVNGVELSGNKTTRELDVRIVGAADFDTFDAAWATKKYVDDIRSSATEEARSVAEDALASKLDADLSNLEAVDAFSGENYVPVVTAGGTKKATIGSIADYAETKQIARSTQLDSALRSERRVIPLAGSQDGRNVYFTTRYTYLRGTSALYFNGQLLTVDKDYEETSASEITLLTHIPTSNDVLIFRAVPSNTKY